MITERCFKAALEQRGNNVSRSVSAAVKRLVSSVPKHTLVWQENGKKKEAERDMMFCRLQLQSQAGWGWITGCTSSIFFLFISPVCWCVSLRQCIIAARHKPLVFLKKVSATELCENVTDGFSALLFLNTFGCLEAWRLCIFAVCFVCIVVILKSRCQSKQVFQSF